MDLGLAGRIAVITGATGGIGQAIARTLAAEGCDVGLLVRDSARGDQLAAEVTSATGKRILTLQADVTRSADVKAAMAVAADQLGGIDILVNAAGGAARGTLEEVDEDQWLAHFAVKPLGLVWACREALPYLRKSHAGRIINIAGGHGKEPTSWTPMGGAINASVLSLSKALADDLAKDGITVNVINPGHTATGRWRRLIDRIASERDVDATEAEKFALERVPIGRPVEPGEIGAAVAFLASVQAGAITGVALSVDGGRARSI